MTFKETLAQVREVLEREGRVAYRILKRRFELSDEDLEDLKADLIAAKRVAVNEDGQVLVWVGEGGKGEKGKWGRGKKGRTTIHSGSRPLTPNSRLCALSTGSRAAPTHCDVL